jgi:CHAT domain-containing protein/tetratricopeptide (TPR) repeat protein
MSLESSQERTEQEQPRSTTAAETDHSPVIQGDSGGEQLPANVTPGGDQEVATYQALQDPVTLNDAGIAALHQYWASGQVANLNRAVECWHEALKLTPSDSPDRPARLNNLGNGLSDRYTRTGNPADLEAAITAFQQAVQATPSDSPDRPARLNNLGSGLRNRYARTGDLADLEQALAAFEKACQSGLGLALEPALVAARTWGNWALERSSWAEAVHAYTYGLEASDKLFQVQRLRASKEAWLREARGLHAHAAYALAQTRDLRGAVATLERGRARLLSQVLERDRADLAQLETLVPEVYRQYITAANRLQALEAQDISGQVVLPPGQTLAEAIRQTRADLDTAVEAIRRVPGYAAFLLPLTFEQIWQTVQDVPLVYVAATPVGGLALIVSLADRERAAAEVTPLWLKDLTEQALREQVQGPDAGPTLGGYLGSYAHWQRNSADAAWHTALDATTRWLWEVLMGPLVQALTDAQVAHAVLIPQGPLSLLPLHAAWMPDHTTPTGRRYVLDAVTFSYAPNARALTIARALAAHTASDALLAVDEPQPVTIAGPLPNSAREVQAAASHFATATILRREEATQERVLAVLRGEEATQQTPATTSPPPIWHFSCHGRANLANPLVGGLVFAHDTWLTLGNLLELRLSGVRLAVLSACETGIPGTQLPDEVIGLPAGLTQAGVAGVVASLWSVSDLSTMLLLVRFYDLWRVEGLVPPEALPRAQIWVRDTTNKEKTDYFSQFLPELTGAAAGVAPNNTSHAVAQALYLKLMLDYEPDQRDFAHPYHWAAFGFTGV